MAEWVLCAVVKYNTVVTVEAETAEEARDKFESGQWLDDGFATAERIDWRSTTKPKEEA